uniref:Putative homing endonuclease n=1 Tax=viral metagenome TaxID=1070528 RepID=A0A6M3ILY0_9ZZZZ
MPNRWKTGERAWAYQYLAERDGEICQKCHGGITEKGALDIDHIDGKKTNNDPRNLRLLCRSCNVAMGNKARSRRRAAEALSIEKEALRTEGRPETRIVRQIVDFRGDESPTSMQANQLYETDFRVWLLSYLRANHFILQEDAVNGGAEAVGCSPQTARRYIAKLTSITGPLNRHRDKLKNTLITFKDEFKEKRQV